MEEEEREEEAARRGMCHGELEGEERNNQVLPFCLLVLFIY